MRQDAFAMRAHAPDWRRLTRSSVYEDGSLCLDILDKNWKPVYTVSSILVSIRSLLTDPNPNSPANVKAASLFRDEPRKYRREVRKCVERSLEAAF